MTIHCISTERLHALENMGYVQRPLSSRKQLFLSAGSIRVLDRHMDLCERITNVTCQLFCCATCLYCPLVCLLTRDARNHLWQNSRAACCCCDGVEEETVFVYDEAAGNGLRCQDFKTWDILEEEERYAKRDLRVFVEQKQREGCSLHRSSNPQASYMLLRGPVSHFSYVLIVPQIPAPSFYPLFPCCNPQTGEPCTSEELQAKALALCSEYHPHMNPVRKVVDCTDALFVRAQMPH